MLKTIFKCDIINWNTYADIFQKEPSSLANNSRFKIFLPWDTEKQRIIIDW
jgi:hypothetical protein